MAVYQVSDLHIHNTRQYRNDKTLKNLKDLAKIFIPQKDVVIFCGDLVDDGFVGQYDILKEALKPFRNHCVLAPGNHDCAVFGFLFGIRLRKNWKKFEKWMNPVTEYYNPDSLITYRFLALDSVLRTYRVRDLSQGKVGFWQRRKIGVKFGKERLSDIRNVVVLHHDPFIEGKWWLKLQDAAHFVGTVLSNNVDYVLYGHSHKSAEIPINNTIFFSAPKFEKLDDVRDAEISI